MLVTIGLFIVCVLISFSLLTPMKPPCPPSPPRMSYNKDKRVGNAITSFIISSIISIAVVGVIVAISYGSYIGLKQKNVIIHQYVESINLYSRLAVPNKSVTRSLEITDLKYQNYQESIKELVQQLRGRIVSYNYVLVGKQELNNNIILNWLIIAPDKDMKILKMEDFISVK